MDDAVLAQRDLLEIARGRHHGENDLGSLGKLRGRVTALRPAATSGAADSARLEYTLIS